MKYFIIPCLLFIFSCKKNAEPNTTIIALYDLSASVDSISLKNYEQISNDIFNKIKAGDVVIGLKISDKSIRERQHIFDLQLPIFNPSSTNSIIKAKELEDHKKLCTESINNAKISLINELSSSHKDIQHTDIMSAIQQVNSIFSNYPSEKKVIVICSDMLEDEDRINFSSTQPNELFVKKIIEEQQKNGNLPKLDNVQVFVEGANASNNDLFFAVKNFWITYFNACGASISEQNYSAHLSNITL